MCHTLLHIVQYCGKSCASRSTSLQLTHRSPASDLALRAAPPGALARAGKHYLPAATIKGPLALYINAFRSHEGLSLTDLPRDLFSNAGRASIDDGRVRAGSRLAAAELKGMSKKCCPKSLEPRRCCSDRFRECGGFESRRSFLPGLWLIGQDFTQRGCLLLQWRFTEKFDADTGEGFGRHVARLKRAEITPTRAVTQGYAAAVFDPRCRTEVETLCDRVQSDLREAVDRITTSSWTSFLTATSSDPFRSVSLRRSGSMDVQWHKTSGE